MYPFITSYSNFLYNLHEQGQPVQVDQDLVIQDHLGDPIKNRTIENETLN